MNLVSVLIING